MKKILFLCLGCLVACQAVWAIHIPYETTFATAQERANWKILSSPSVGDNQLMFGDLGTGYRGGQVLYITADGGATCSYKTYASSRYNLMAYDSLGVLPKGQYEAKLLYKMPVGNFNKHISLSMSTQNYAPSSVSDGSKYHNATLCSGDWTTLTYTFSSAGNESKYLCCHISSSLDVRDSVYNQGIQIGWLSITRISDGVSNCISAPTGIHQIKREGNNAIFGWRGMAAEYEAELFLTESSNPFVYSMHELAFPTCTIPSDLLPQNGAYTLRVRPICGRDTGNWTAVDYLLLYDKNTLCMDYLNLHDSSVLAEYGVFDDPSRDQGVIDWGPYDIRSRHTTHVMGYDLQTNYHLSTIPKDGWASVRLGNWNTYGEAEDIIYTMHVREGMDIIKLQYAVVLENPNHSDYDQPRFTLETLDDSGQLIDSCAFADFTAAGNLVGWNSENRGDIIWKDWTLIGLNLSPYMGQTIKIRLTTKDCAYSAHYGYAYFSMDCASGRIQGVRCGEKADSLSLPDGFYYRWYKKYDNPDEIISRDQTFYITDPRDTITYAVDLINKMDTNCYYTLEASSLAFFPRAKATATWSPQNCQNYIQIEDQSYTEGVYWEEDGTEKVARVISGVDQYRWDFGKYGTSTERNPRILMPDEGGTVHVKLYASAIDGGCLDSCEFDITADSIGNVTMVHPYYMCEGHDAVVDGVHYSQPCDLVDSAKTIYGCDSISIIAIRLMQIDTMSLYDTICTQDYPYTWREFTITEPGQYESVIPAICGGCDSILYVMNLQTREQLLANIGDKTQSYCANTVQLEIPFSVEQGSFTSYSIRFAADAAEHGIIGEFENLLPPLHNTFLASFAPGVWPGEYEAFVVLNNHDCDSLILTVPFEVHYTADSVITQRWNDLLSVRKTAFDLYGGFHDYQWYKNGSPLSGETRSQLYLPTEGVDMDATYSVEFTRDADGVRLRSCEFVPTMQPATSTMAVYPTLLSPAAPLHVVSGEAGAATIYNRTGAQVATWQLTEGENVLTAPVQLGLYILRVTDVDGQNNVVKLIVE